MITILSCLVLNLLFGRLVALLIDNKHRDLERWLHQAPHWISYLLVLELWPIFLFSAHTRWRSK